MVLIDLGGGDVTFEDPGWILLFQIDATASSKTMLSLHPHPGEGEAKLRNMIFHSLFDLHKLVFSCFDQISFIYL